MKIRPFPTASGFLNIDGGREGRVIFIENLNNSGTGSAREALLTTETRIVIPRVSGYVDLTSNISLFPSSSNPYIHSNLTYLGGLNPGDGLVFRDQEVMIAYNRNIIIRGLVSRLGDRLGIGANNKDSFNLANTATFPNENIIVDRSSFSWGVDETFSFAGLNITVQYCIIAEGLNDSFHEKGQHGYGGIAQGENLSIHHNLISRFTQRMFLFGNGRDYPNAVYDFRNNALYAWAQDPSKIMPENLEINIIKNSYKPTDVAGADVFKRTIALYNDLSADTIQERIHPFGNVIDGFPEVLESVESQKQGIRGRNGTLSAFKDDIVNVTEYPIPWVHNFSETVTESNQKIKDYAGSIKRDSVDARIIDEWWNGTNPVSGSKTGLLGIIDSQEDVGGFPALDTTSDPILTGAAPHYLPEWFTTKYSLSTVFNYTLSGTKSASPERFIIFKGGQGVQLSQYVGTVNLETDLIYNVYEVLYMHYVPISSTEFEIDLLEDGVIEPTLYPLTITTTTGGTVSQSPLGTSFTAGTSITLTATASEGFVFSRYRNPSNNETLSTNAVYTFSKSASAQSIQAVFVSDVVIPPNQKRFFARKKPTA